MLSRQNSGISNIPRADSKAAKKFQQYTKRYIAEEFWKFLDNHESEESFSSFLK